MQELTDAQKARHAIREFKTITDGLALRGFYRPSGKSGKQLETCLKNLSPEIYGSMNDSRVVELKGLEYVIDRLPKGIEECSRIILTEEDPVENNAFERITPLKRRRTSYRISSDEICFVISRGLSEIYDIITHMTFLYSEAKKIHSRMKDDSGNPTIEWSELEKTINRIGQLSDKSLEQALWNLSIILGRPYQETRETYKYLEENKKTHQSNSGLFALIHGLGNLIEKETVSKESTLVVYLTPSLMNTIGHQKYGKLWAQNIKDKLRELDILKRPIHIISANMHSIVNLLFGHDAMQQSGRAVPKKDLYQFCHQISEMDDMAVQFGKKHGLYELPDVSGTHINCQIVDTARLDGVAMHPQAPFDAAALKEPNPVIVVMDYAFGAQAFELMENLLKPYSYGNSTVYLNIRSISIMGKAGILEGDKGDIMIATAHVFEGTSDNYIFENDLKKTDFDKSVDVYTGPMVTVLGTSLQNRDVLHKFQSDWKTVGLEMEGGHYQRAISAAIIKGNISRNVKLHYAYYASDNPLKTGHTLAAGAMGKEGIKPTYMITKVLLEKIFAYQ